MFENLESKNNQENQANIQLLRNGLNTFSNHYKIPSQQNFLFVHFKTYPNGNFKININLYKNVSFLLYFLATSSCEKTELLKQMTHNSNWFADELSKLMHQETRQLDLVTVLQILFWKTALAFSKKYGNDPDCNHQSMFYASTLLNPFFSRNIKDILSEQIFDDENNSIDQNTVKYEIGNEKRVLFLECSTKESAELTSDENASFKNLKKTFQSLGFISLKSEVILKKKFLEDAERIIKEGKEKRLLS